MPQPSNKISQFWQELKRRKVARWLIDKDNILEF